MGFGERSANKPFGPQKGARLLACGLVLIGAAPVWAADSYRCVFDQECVTGEACSDTDPKALQFSRADGNDTWSLAALDGQVIAFRLLPTKAEDLRAFVSTSFDPGASAVALLTLFGGGQAILGIHGVFFTPGSVTHMGTCVPKDG